MKIALYKGLTFSGHAMKLITMLCAALGALAISNAAQAAQVRYTSISDFNNATTNRLVEPNSAPAGDYTYVGFETVNGISYPDNAYMIDPGYAPDVYDWGSGAVLLLDGIAKLSFAPTHAFAADFGTLNTGAPITVTINGVSTVVNTALEKRLTFYGWVSDTAFTSVSFSTPEQYLILDNVTRANSPNVPPPVDIPEPGGVLLAGLAMALLAHRRRRAVS